MARKTQKGKAGTKQEAAGGMDDKMQALLYAMQQQNLVYNHDFLYFSNKGVESSLVVYHHPDGWVYADDDASGASSIGYSPNDDSCVIITGKNTTEMTFSQALNEFPRWEKKLAGKTVTAKAYANLGSQSDTDVEISFSLDDGISRKTESIRSRGDITLEVQLDISTNPKYLKVAVESPTPSATIKISEVCANVGSVAIESLSCIVNGIIGERRQYVATENPPAEELSLCNGVVGLDSNKTRLDSVLNGRFGTDEKGVSLLPNMAGYFSRSWDNGAGMDPDADERTALGGKTNGDHVGTVESDAFRTHSHPLNFDQTAIAQGPSAPGVGLNLSAQSKTGKEGGKETRPVNISELYTMKWS